MFNYLKVPWAKTLDDVLIVSKRKLTSAKQELGIDLSFQEAYQALVKGYTKALKVEFEEKKLTKYELKSAETIRKERLVSEEWTFLGKLST